MRTSHTHPLRIASVRPYPSAGRVGLTFCPGKKKSRGLTGPWCRDLDTDLDVIENWGAAAVVTLLEPRELISLGVAGLGASVEARYIQFFHVPIVDVSVPDTAFEESWQIVGPQLRDFLRSGFDVLVHCRGGLGRAGLVAARLLIELGQGAEQAVSRIRQVRPGAIETPEQLAYVLAQRPVPEPEPCTSAAAIADRAVGSMLGLALGDATGTTLEFAQRDSHPRLRDMEGGGPFGLAAGEWTDDTAMSLALADSLLHCPGLDEADLMQRFTDWYEKGHYSCTGQCFDIGLATRRAIIRWQKTKDPIAGSADPVTAGNGSLMRLAPVAVRHHSNRTLLRDVAARQSRVTHGANEAVDACVAFAERLADAIEGSQRSQVLRPEEAGWAGQVAPVMSGSWRGKIRSEIRSSGYVVDSLEASLWSTGRTNGFREAILLAANLADDADTVGAITGQLAGALYGASHLPEEWRAKLAWGARIQETARALLASR